MKLELESELKSLDIPSVAIVSTVIGALWGLIVGTFLVGIGGVSVPGLVSLKAGIIGILLPPAIFAILGLIVGTITAFLYNVVAEYIGGIEMGIVLEEEE